jgi:hypothetical protein
MISLRATPDRIIQGDTLKLELEITGQLNNKTYYGKYFNITLKKNGSTDSSNLYPLRYNYEPLVWEVNPNSYEFHGTYTANCVLQGGPLITSTTFIIYEDCVVGKVDTCNNLASIENYLNIKSAYIKNKEPSSDVVQGSKVQKKGDTLKVAPLPPLKTIEAQNPVNTIGGKIQKSGYNVGSKTNNGSCACETVLPKFN